MVKHRPLLFLICFLSCLGGIAMAQPFPLRGDISIRRIFTVENDCVRIARDLSTSKLYYVRANGGIYEFNPDSSTKTLRYSSTNHKVTVAQGFTISYDGTFFLVGNPTQGSNNIGIVVRGKVQSVVRVWDTVAITEPYPQSLTGHDHLFNAIEVTPDHQYLIVNSGSRTDHGDTARVLNGGREYPITSALFKLPYNTRNILLRNNQDSLNPYLYADGVRNAYDMAFAPNGDLFAIDNSDVADHDEELNWIREGHHYGFPWRISTDDNPQQFSNFNPNTWYLLNIVDHSYFNDPAFPPKPAGIIFTDPIRNVGPDADHFRDTNRTVRDASTLGRTLGTFTSHSSPLALVFDFDSVVTSEFAGHGFVMSYNDSSATKFAPFHEPGEDLLHLELTKIVAEDRYEAHVTRIAQGFHYPVDAVMVRNKIYVVENGAGSSLWEVTLPARPMTVKQTKEGPAAFRLDQNYPNPFNPTTTIRISIPSGANPVTLRVYDILGREIATLKNEVMEAGTHDVRFEASRFASGLYCYRLQSGSFAQTKTMLLLK